MARIGLCAGLLIAALVDASGASALAQQQLAADTAPDDARRRDVHGAGQLDVDERRSGAPLDPPEPDAHLVLVDVPDAKDADAAVAAAWAGYRPEAKWPLRLALPDAPRNGWEERRALQLRDLAQRELDGVRPGLAGRARSGSSLIVDASDPTFEKRGSQFSVVINSLRPTGYTARDLRRQERRTRSTPGVPP